MEQLSPALFDTICRACMSSEETAVRISEVTYQDLNLGEILRECIAVEIEENDGLPKKICKSCITVLVQLHAFKQQCRRSDKLLRTALDEHNRMSSSHPDSAKLEAVSERNGEANGSRSRPPRPKAHSHAYGRNDRATTRRRTKNVIERENLKERRPVSADSSLALVFECKRCKESFDSYGGLVKHRQQVKHPRPRNYVCPECYKSFSYSHLQQHMRTHTKEKPFPCHVCQMRFSLKCNLRRHLMIHTGERPHTCDICGKGFIQATTLVDHKRTHTGETPFVCSYCGMSFSQSSRHKAHLKRHQIENGNGIGGGDDEEVFVRRNECGTCQRRFATRGILKTHMLTHGEKTFLCSQCGKGFVSNAGLLSHTKVHTGIKPYPCTVCSKAFSQLGSLKSHVLIHTGQKPFICKVCSKAFTQRNHLKYHARTHSGERPYVCIYCEKSFALKGTLTIHVRTHTGETPYLCDVCGRGFYDSSSMKKHKRAHGPSIKDDNEKTIKICAGAAATRRGS